MVSIIYLYFYVLQNSTATSFPAPTDSIIKNTCENPIQLPSNLEDKEHFILKNIMDLINLKKDN